jgi:hypothetical protein
MEATVSVAEKKIARPASRSFNKALRPTAQSLNEI